MTADAYRSASPELRHVSTLDGIGSDQRVAAQSERVVRLRDGAVIDGITHPQGDPAGDMISGISQPG